jgi:ubiquinone/menaquinone biosynthesis C-methylase UbiE
MADTFSISEEHGLAAIPENSKLIYSVGVSTAGAAELRMADGHPERHIIATTIDEAGVQHVTERVQASGNSGQLEIKLEDVGKPLPYPENHFDYIYARLVLHYLPKQDLPAAVAELKRVLKPGGKLFVVVRSDKTPDAVRDTSTFDPATGLTDYIDPYTHKVPVHKKRMFHSQGGISQFLSDAGFAIERATSYEERLFGDFNRTIQAEHFDNLVEVLAVKPVA